MPGSPPPTALRVTWAEATHDSPYGRIESSWSISDDVFRLTVTVPPGTSAEVVLPDGTTAAQTPGTTSYECPPTAT